MQLFLSDGNDERFDRALRHKLRGEYNEAIALFQAIITDQPSNADAYNELGLTHSYLVNQDESIAALEKAVAFAPHSKRFLMDLGKTHTMYGDYDKAKPVFDTVLEMDPFHEDW